MRLLSARGLSLLLCIALRAEDWPQWHGPNRDGAWNDTGILESFPPGGLKISWRAPVGRGWSSPVVARGRVYLTDAQVARPTVKERVLCFDETTGKLLWSREYPVDYPDWAFDPNAGGPRATPIVRDGKLFTRGATSQLFCLDAANGDVLWEKSLAKEYGLEPFSGITPSPLIEDELLILYICGKPAACVVALDKNSGKEVWRALDDAFTYSSPIIVAAGGKRQLIVWTQSAVTSLDPATGKTWWREMLQTPGDTAVSSPVSTNHRLLIGGLMFQLDADKPAAAVIWPESRAVSKRVLSNTSTALLQGEYVYSAKTSGELVCLEAGTGKQIWQTNSVTRPGNGSSIHLTSCGEAVFLFTDQGDLIRAQLTPQGYREISRAHLLEPTAPFGDRKCAWTPPAYANRHVFARNDAELVCASLAAEPYSRITEDAFKARLPFFDYDKAIPLEGRIVRQWDSANSLRQKIVFRGAQGFLVPGQIEFPKSGAKPVPLVLLLHGWSGSKEDWWKDDSYISGGIMRKALLEAGYAVLALDAATHGERAREIDFQHVNVFDDPKAPAQRNYFTYPEIAIQTVKDYRRALDFVAERGEVDLKRIGLVGYSMGGMDAFYLVSVERRIHAAVACVPPLLNASYGPASPIDYSWGIGRTPFLMLMGRNDEMGDPARVEASYQQFIKGPNTRLTWYDAGHKLPPTYVRDAMAWLKERL